MMRLTAVQLKTIAGAVNGHGSVVLRRAYTSPSRKSASGCIAIEVAGKRLVYDGSGNLRTEKFYYRGDKG